MSYLTSHYQMFLKALQRSHASLLSTLMMFLVIGVTFTLPSISFLVVQNLKSISENIQHESQISIFLKKDTSADAKNRIENGHPNDKLSKKGMSDDFSQDAKLGNVVSLKYGDETYAAPSRRAPSPPILNERRSRGSSIASKDTMSRINEENESKNRSKGESAEHNDSATDKSFDSGNSEDLLYLRKTRYRNETRENERSAPKEKYEESQNNSEISDSESNPNHEPHQMFDFIIFNPPYVQSDDEDVEVNDSLLSAWAGGERGRIIIDQFLSELPKFLSGFCFLLLEKTNNVQEVCKMIHSLGFKTRQVIEKRVAGEYLHVILIMK